MNGRRTVEDIWRQACDRTEGEGPTQSEVVHLLAQMHMADALQTPIPPDISELAERGERQRHRAFWQRFKNPLALRLPLFDPDRFLAVTLPFVRPLFSWPVLLLWAITVAAAAVQAAVHWDPLTEDIVDRAFATENVILMIVLYPLIKAVHELGHAYAAKVWGAEVHEMGIMFLVLMPVPYVDASSSAAFREKWRRAGVAAMGIIVEAFIAAVALFVWLNAETGLVRAGAYNTMLVAGVSTLLFNGNPLLRFDGYFTLADALEIPNLGTRSNRYLLYLIQRYAFGTREAVSPATSDGERRSFVIYGLAAFVYRLFIMTAIVLFVATQFFFFGVLLAGFAIYMMVVKPLVKGVAFLVQSPRLAGTRRRAMLTTMGIIGAVVVGLGFVPVPYATVTEGIVWAREETHVIARSDGIVVDILAAAGAHVRQGQPLLRLEDPLLDAQIKVLESERREFSLRHEAAKVTDLVEARIIAERLLVTEAELEDKRDRARHRMVLSPADGRLALLSAADLKGRFVRNDQRLGYVARPSQPTIRAIVEQDDIDTIRQRTVRVDIRTSDDVRTAVRARIERAIPAATEQLPSPALSTQGGGTIVLSPEAREAPIAIEPVFLFDLALDGARAIDTLGGRVYVRFDHGNEPVAFRIYRRLRQIFLRKFNV